MFTGAFQHEGRTYCNSTLNKGFIYTNKWALVIYKIPHLDNLKTRAILWIQSLSKVMHSPVFFMMFLNDVTGYIQGSESENRQSWLAIFLLLPRKSNEIFSLNLLCLSWFYSWAILHDEEKIEHGNVYKKS